MQLYTTLNLKIHDSMIFREAEKIIFSEIILTIRILHHN